MLLSDPLPAFEPIPHQREPDPEDRYAREELALASRNRGMPLEALRYATTPTGLHYLLIHFDIPAVEPAAWRLEVKGLVERPLVLTLDDLRARRRVTRRITMECAGNGRALMHPRPVSQAWLDGAVSTAEWTGTPLGPLLDEAGIRPGAVDVVFTGIDAGMEAGQVQRYQRSLTVGDARSDDVLLAFAMNGEALQPQHGAPLRLLVAGWYGMASVKWLAGIEVIDRPFEGHYMVGTYRYASAEGDLGDPVTTQRVRALLTPPGLPEWYTRRRLVSAGRIRLEGRAWAGRRSVAGVEVSTDGGRTFADAALEPPAARCCWQGFSSLWDAQPGATTLIVRATDSAGEAQPLEPLWNRHGMGNNVAQRIPVTVA
jgi:sulfane dehydrogenase subunit SoxC